MPDVPKYSVNTGFRADSILLLALLHRAGQLFSVTNSCTQGSHSLYFVLQKNVRFKESNSSVKLVFFFFPNLMFKVSVVLQNLLDEIARREEEVHTVCAHSQQYQQAVKVSLFPPGALHRDTLGRAQRASCQPARPWGQQRAIRHFQKRDFYCSEQYTGRIYPQGENYQRTTMEDKQNHSNSIIYKSKRETRNPRNGRQQRSGQARSPPPTCWIRVTTLTEEEDQEAPG